MGAGAISKAVPKNVKDAAEAASRDTQHIAKETAEGAEHVAMRIKNGNPNMHTTTVAPRNVSQTPSIADPWSHVQPAVASIQHHLMHWAWPVVHSVLVISGLFALTELCVATGRHLPSYQKGCAKPVWIAGRVLRDTYSQWMNGVALLVAAWVLSIILAPNLQRYAAKALDIVDSGSSSLASLQIVLCITCLLASCGRASWMARSDCSCYACSKKSESGSREELRPIQKTESESDLDVPASDAAGSSSMSCWVFTAGVDAVLVAMERPVTTFALGTCYKSYFAFRFLAGLLPWTVMAPTILGYTPSSPYELLIPVAFVAFLIGGMLVLARKKSRRVTFA